MLVLTPESGNYTQIDAAGRRKGSRGWEVWQGSDVEGKRVPAVVPAGAGGAHSEGSVAERAVD